MSRAAAQVPVADSRLPIDARLVVLVLLLAVPQALLAWFGATESLVLVGAALFLAAAALAYANTFAGLLLIILFQVSTLQSSIEINAGEIAYAVLFGVTLLGWFIRHARTPEGRRVTSSPLGRAITCFFFIAVASLVPALLHGGSALWWFRDLVRFSPLALFFPIATVAQSRRRSAALGIAFLTVVIYFSVHALLTYSQMLSVATFASEMRWQRAPVNEVLPMVVLVVASTLFFMARSRMQFLVAVILGAPSTLALAVSLSRGFWAAGLIAIIVSAFASGARPRRVLGFLLILCGVVLVCGYVVFGWRLFGVLASLGGRFSTFSSPFSQLTVYERLTEARAQLELVRRNPIIGYGLGAWFRYMSPIRGYARETAYVHNAYIFLAFKLGLVGLVSYLVLYLKGIGRVLRSGKMAVSIWMRAPLFAGFGVLVAFLPLSLTSPQFYSKSAGLVIALVLGVAQAVVLSRETAGLEARS